VWRGGSIGQETDRRKAEIERLYKCGDPGEAKRIAQKLGASFIVVGSVERRLYPEAGLDAVVRSGKVVFRAGECVVISVQE
jgi:uncharacterized membrane protein